MPKDNFDKFITAGMIVVFLLVVGGLMNTLFCGSAESTVPQSEGQVSSGENQEGEKN